MAGNRERFKEAQQKAEDLVWEERWEEAVKAYRRALEEFPENDSALMGYAWAQYNAGKLDEAAEAYERLIELSPQDPVPPERLAEIREEQGEPQDAPPRYMEAARRYADQDMVDRQVEALEAAVRIDPSIADAWADLFKHYQDRARMEKAVLAALWLAHLYQDEHPRWAIEICRQAQTVAPQDPRISQALTLLQTNRPVPQPAGIDEFTLVDVKDEIGGETAGEEQGSPTEIARQRALEALAESVFDEDRPAAQGISEADARLLIGKAVDAQMRGEVEEAVNAYERLLDAGISMPSIHFNLGILYKEQMRFEEAIEQLQHSLDNSEYVLGTHFSLGEAYQAQGQFEKALQHFIEAVKVIDLATVERDHVDDLIRVYGGLAESLVNTGEQERIQQLLQSLVDFFGNRGWEEGVMKARKRLDSLARNGTVLGLAEIISLPGSEDVLRSVALAQEYARRKKFYSALEELEYSIGKAPLYLPLHSILASLYMESGNLEAALNKYITIAKTYEIRGQILLALATYTQILELSPLDIAIHVRMINLLIQRGQIDDALGQSLRLADAYYQLAQPERARERYAEALRLAPRGTPERKWEIRILHRMADLDMQRLDWNAAIRDYEQITEISPGDERAHLGLLRLYTRVGRVQRGIAALDRLIRRYLETRRVEKAVAILEDLVQEEPASIPLRFRAARLCLSAGKREQALEHLDILGDLQLQAGQDEAALKTIENILSLNPENVEGYMELYRDLGGRTPPKPAE